MIELIGDLAENPQFSLIFFLAISAYVMIPADPFDYIVIKRQGFAPIGSKGNPLDRVNFKRQRIYGYTKIRQAHPLSHRLHGEPNAPIALISVGFNHKSSKTLAKKHFKFWRTNIFLPGDQRVNTVLYGRRWR